MGGEVVYPDNACVVETQNILSIHADTGLPNHLAL
jgi:hypothetical protein